jgi:hypothetical protein
MLMRVPERRGPEGRDLLWVLVGVALLVGGAVAAAVGLAEQSAAQLQAGQFRGVGAAFSASEHRTMLVAHVWMFAGILVTIAGAVVLWRSTFRRA